MSPAPEQQARVEIDAALTAAGWIIRDRLDMNLAAGPGVAVREFRMTCGHGFSDYLLFVGGKAVGVLEAKPAGYVLSNVELQADLFDLSHRKINASDRLFLGDPAVYKLEGGG